jgi:hypothetical protein
MSESFAERWSLCSSPPELRRAVAMPVLVPSPAAGSDWSLTVPGTWWWRVLAISYVLATSAVVASRNLQLRYTDADGNILAQLHGGGAAVPAATTMTASLWVGGPSSTSNAGLSLSPLPDMVLRPGWKISTSTAGLDAGDQFSAIVVTAEHYPSNWASGEVAAERREELERVLAGGQLLG